MTGRLLVLRRKTREQILMPMGKFTRQEHAMQSLYREHKLAQLPLAKVGSTVKGGKGRIQEVEYFPPQITCGSRVHTKGKEKTDSGVGKGEKKGGRVRGRKTRREESPQ